MQFLWCGVKLKQVKAWSHILDYHRPVFMCRHTCILWCMKVITKQINSKPHAWMIPEERLKMHWWYTEKMKLFCCEPLFGSNGKIIQVNLQYINPTCLCNCWCLFSLSFWFLSSPHRFLLTLTSCPLNPPTSPGLVCPPSFLHSSSPASPPGVLRLPRVTGPDKLGILSTSKLQAIRSPKDNI